MWNKANANVINYCEHYGIYEIYRVRNNLITYYSWYPIDCYGNGRFYRITVNCGDRRTIERRELRYKKTPKFLKGKDGLRYNYKVG